jgi:CDP-diacylglycerol--glycerol-3-phosphate 3-phosphatidyltransferase/cardiolipin synthase
MGAYSVRDVFRVPSLVSLIRVPLAAAFPASLEDPRAGLALIGAAGLTDVIDGWYARKFGQATPTGAVVDPVTDKLFVLTVVVSLVAAERLPLVSALLLGTREIGELPLVIYWSASRTARKRRADHPKANVPGKLATMLQFAAITAALFRSPHTEALALAAGAGGVLAAISYWRRALRPAPAG